MKTAILLGSLTFEQMQMVTSALGLFEVWLYPAKIGPRYKRGLPGYLVCNSCYVKTSCKLHRPFAGKPAASPPAQQRPMCRISRWVNKLWGHHFNVFLDNLIGISWIFNGNLMVTFNGLVEGKIYRKPMGFYHES